MNTVLTMWAGAVLVVVVLFWLINVYDIIPKPKYISDEYGISFNEPEGWEMREGEILPGGIKAAVAFSIHTRDQEALIVFVPASTQGLSGFNLEKEASRIIIDLKSEISDLKIINKEIRTIGEFRGYEFEYTGIPQSFGHRDRTQQFRWKRILFGAKGKSFQLIFSSSAEGYKEFINDFDNLVKSVKRFNHE